MFYLDPRRRSWGLSELFFRYCWEKIPRTIPKQFIPKHAGKHLNRILAFRFQFDVFFNPTPPPSRSTPPRNEIRLTEKKRSPYIRIDCLLGAIPQRTLAFFSPDQAVILAVQRALCSRDRALWVVNASGLCKADFFGKSDPYAKVCVKRRNIFWWTLILGVFPIVPVG